MRRSALLLLSSLTVLTLGGCSTLGEVDVDGAPEARIALGAASAQERRRLWEETLSYSEALSGLPPEVRERAHVQQQVQQALTAAATDYANNPQPLYLLRHGLLAVLAHADEAVLVQVQRDVAAYVAQVGLAGEHDEWLVSARLLLYILKERELVRAQSSALAQQRQDLSAVQQALVKRMLEQEAAHAAKTQRLAGENRELRSRLATQKAEFQHKLEQLKGIEQQLHERTGTHQLEGLP